ncbi:MAG: 1,4-dihydroxy-2-naphthoate octaprenyltransferase [Methanobacteriota archaeon]|nr:MAG: 1,4-dihydroxy-2-naphthoate octaprenyltransferase [Euryarchaeota archaeon]
MTTEPNGRSRAGLKIWFLEMRAPFFTATIIPTSFGAVFAWYEGVPFNILLFLTTLLGVLFLHAGTNVVNDYFDYISGTDRVNRNRSPFNGGSPFIVEGILTPQQVYRAAIAFFAIGGILGILLAFSVSILIIPLGVLGIGLGYFYTAPKINLAAKGLGEIAVGLGFGPLVVGGAYLVQSGELVLLPFIAGLPIGLLIGLVLFINQFPDVEADGAVGKTHWVVRMGLAKASILYAAIMASTFIVIILLWIAGVYPLLSLLGLIPAAIAVKAVRTTLLQHGRPSELLPAQAMTVQIHLLVGLLIITGLIASEIL